MSMFPYSLYEDIPTFEEVKSEISNIVGLPNVKPQLELVIERIMAAERLASHGYGVVPPKPFHMAFVGNSGTGKSMVAQILGKLFYLAGVLPSYNVTEMMGMTRKIAAAKGGILLIDVNENEYNSKTLDEVASAMDEGKISVIFAGPREALNKCIQLNKNLYAKIAVMLRFDDFNCEELAMMLQNKMYGQAEVDVVRGFKLHTSCSVENVGKIIAEESCEELRSNLNAFLIEPILRETTRYLNNRVGLGPSDQTVVTLEDLQAAVHVVTHMYRKFVGF